MGSPRKACRPAAAHTLPTCPPRPPPPLQILEVLQRSGYIEKRAAKMSQDDFLALLAAFNAGGIHFT